MILCAGSTERQLTDASTLAKRAVKCTIFLLTTEGFLNEAPTKVAEDQSSSKCGCSALHCAVKISWGLSAALGAELTISVSSADVQSLLTGLLQHRFSCALEERPPRSEPANPASPLAEGKEECLAMSLGTAFTSIFHVHALELALSACCQKAKILVCRGAE